jgi:hypothetical protein
MILNVQASQVTDIASKWELAQRMSAHAKVPEEALMSLFTGAMQGLEQITKTTFETSMKERVWDAVSKEKLKSLKEALMFEFCEKILGGFNEDQASEMLEEHKRTGFVENSIYSFHLQVAYALSRELISDAVVQKALSMRDVWIPEIVEAVRKEGIQIPNPIKAN